MNEVIKQKQPPNKSQQPLVQNSHHHMNGLKWQSSYFGSIKTKHLHFCHYTITKPVFILCENVHN